jgi:lipopolysaccharide export system protein LptA
VPVPGLKSQLRSTTVLTCCALTLAAGLYCAHDRVRGETAAVGPSDRDSIAITADFGQVWNQGTEQIHVLRGRCRIVQGTTTIQAKKVVLWRRTDAAAAAAGERATVYLEEEVRYEKPGSTLTERMLLVELASRGGLSIQTTHPLADVAAADDPTFLRAVRRRSAARPGGIHLAQYAPGDAEPVPELRSVQLTSPAGATRRVRIFPRGSGQIDVETKRSENTTPPEQIWILTRGVNVLVDGVHDALGTVDLSADRVVIWTTGNDFNLGGETVQDQRMPFQVYLEGNIIIRQGENVLRASRAFYDARENRALLLNAELKTRIANLPAKIRVRADELRQLSRDTFQAEQAWITTSGYGRPGYRLQASNIFVEPRYESWIGRNPTRIDPETGQVVTDTTLWATSLNNSFFVEDVPVFYFPYLSVPAEDPNIPLRNISVANDQVFGTQVRTTWDMFKLLGIDSPPATRWDLQADYLSKRGPQIGTSGNYSGVNRWWLEGPYQGEGYVSFIYDTGNDNLGTDRQNLIPKQEGRGGLSIQDRQILPGNQFFPWNMTLFSEIGYVTDRNWLEQFREQDFDNGKDLETLVGLKQNMDNWAWSALVRPRLYNYYNTTEWLPRGDLYALSEPLFNGLLTWSSHSYAGYANQRIADPATDPADLYTVLPFEADAQGVVASTRHGLNLPFDLGPVHLVPYVVGEAAYWGESFGGGSVDRLYGSAGLRGSVEMWRVFPNVYSDIFNLNGLAHKMVFDADYSFADSSENLSSIVQYNEFDDNAQEQFRRRLVVNTFGGTLPAPFDPRAFAVRSGAAADVTTPFNELVDSLHVVRLGWRHRLQTKVGPVNAPRIRNWMTLDLETAYFPDDARDNFGEPFGLYGARYNLYVGDRTTLTAGAYFDTFNSSQKLWNIGLMTQRDTRGSVYVGFRQIAGGPLDSQILTASYSYVLSPKWVTTMGTAYDFGEGQNRGQSFTVTRVGSDFLVHFGANVDPTKNNVGVGISIEPRFAPFTGTSGFSGMGTQLGSLVPKTY